MNDEIPRWMQTFLTKPVTIGWRIYCVCYFRWMILRHYMRGDITLVKLFYILLPPRMRPRSFDYFR